MYEFTEGLKFSGKVYPENTPLIELPFVTHPTDTNFPTFLNVSSC